MGFDEVVTGYEISRDPGDGRATSFDKVAKQRINELLSAIGKYMNIEPLTRDMTQRANLLAIELQGQIELVDTLLIYSS